jgi:hypothetical protein
MDVSDMSDRTIGDECFLKPDPVTGKLRPVDRNGSPSAADEIEIEGLSISSKGLVRVSPDGHRWLETISDLGVVTREDLGR